MASWSSLGIGNKICDCACFDFQRVGTLRKTPFCYQHPVDVNATYSTCTCISLRPVQAFHQVVMENKPVLGRCVPRVFKYLQVLSLFKST